MAGQRPLALVSGVLTQINAPDQIQTPDGSGTAPGVLIGSTHGYFNNITNTGIGVVIGGAQIGWWNATGLTLQIAGGGNSFITITGEGPTRSQIIRYSDDATSANFVQMKARGTIASPAVPVTSDSISSSVGQAWTGAAFTSSAQISMQLTETSVVDATHIGSRIRFLMCPVGSGTLVEVARLENETGLSLLTGVVIDQNRILRTRSYTVATLPTITSSGDILVSNESGSPTPSWSDGSNWRRYGDNQVVSSSTPSARGLVTRCTGGVSYSNQDIIHRTYQKLSDAGLLTKLLGLWVHAGFPQTTADAVRNWITLGICDLVIVGSPTWTQLGGFTGDGTTALLNTATTAANLGATQNSFTMGAYVLVASGSAAAVLGQDSSALSRGIYMQSAPSGALTVRCMDATNDTFTPTRYTGLFTMSRVLSTGFNASLDDLAASAITRNSAALTVRIPCFLGTSDTTGNEFSTAQIAFSFIGNGLTATDIANLRAIMVDYYLVQTKVISSTYLVGTLPGSVAAYEGQKLIVSDASVAASGNFGATLTGGGSNHVPCYYESGTPAWRIG